MLDCIPTWLGLPRGLVKTIMVLVWKVIKLIECDKFSELTFFYNFTLK